MAEYARGQGQEVHQQKGTERRRLRQQQIQHCCGGGHVQGGDDQLQQGQAGAGQAQGTATDLDQQVVRDGLLWQASTINTHCQQREQGKEGHGNRAQQIGGQVQGFSGSRQVAQSSQSSERWQRATQRQAGEQRHACDFSGTEAVAGVETIAYRAAGKQRQADGIADGEGGKAA